MPHHVISLHVTSLRLLTQGGVKFDFGGNKGGSSLTLEELWSTDKVSAIQFIFGKEDGVGGVKHKV